MRGATGCWLVLLVTLGLASPLIAADPPAIDPTWRERARTEGRAAYEKYVEVSSRLDAVAETRTAIRPGGATGSRPFRPQTRREWTIRLGDLMILEQTRTLDGPSDPPDTRLECDNADYHFTLGKGAAGYSLIDYGPGPRKLALTRQSGPVHTAVFSEFQDALEAVDGSSRYVLKAIHWDQPKGLLRIAYTYQIDNSPVNNDVWVDPQHAWRVVESRGETKSSVFTDIVSYGIPVGGLDFPSGFKNDTRYKVSNAPPDMEITGRVISLKIADKGPEDFRLAAFGLPEPVDVAPRAKGIPRYVWFLVGAAVLGILAVGFRSLSRRRAARLSA